MREMKDSGVAWIGKIPENWIVLKNSVIFKNVSIKNHGKDMVLSLYRDLGIIPKDSRDDNHNVTSLDTDSYKFVECGDLVINKMKAWSGSVAVSDYTGIVSPAYYVCKINYDYVNKRFIHHYLRNSKIVNVYEMLSAGMRIGQWDLGIDDFLRIEIAIPPIEEQQKIAAYLDRKCTQIDALIANAEQQIEKLKVLRDAVLREILSEGANITGICREQYTTTKMGSIGTYKKGPFGSSLKKSMFVPKGEKTFKVYEQKNAIYKNATLGYYYISEEKFNELKSFEICPGDIIISCAGTIGECYEIPVDAEKGIINQALMYVRLNKDMDTLFFTYLFEYVIKTISLTDSNGSAMKNIPPFDKIKPFIISIPSTKENQHKLAEYIQKKIKTITDLVEIKQKKIEKLQQYKKSLIYEYVTGKKEVS